MTTPPIPEKYKGVCIVQAIYDIDDKKPDISERFFHDWYNYDPDRSRILRGTGYIRTIKDKQYVITCNHIMVKYASYIGYCYDELSEIVNFNMIIHFRIPELDLVIMEILTKL